MAPTDPRRNIGDRGEAIARAWLESQGYVWVVSNWHCRAGELDLVMVDHDVLVIVEVKTRRSLRAGRPDDAVSPTKVRRVLAAAEWFIADHPEYQEHLWRCDLVAIAQVGNGPPAIRHYQNALVSG